MPVQSVAEVTNKFQAMINNREQILQGMTNTHGQPTRLPMGKEPTEPMPIDNPLPLRAMILVPDKYRAGFENSPLYPMVQLQRVVNKVYIFETRSI